MGRLEEMPSLRVDYMNIKLLPKSTICSAPASKVTENEFTSECSKSFASWPVGNGC